MSADDADGATPREGSGLMGLLTNPIGTALGVASAAVGGVASAASAVAAAPEPQAAFTEDTLRLIIYQLHHGDARLQQQVLRQHYSPDVLFSAGAASSVLGTQAEERSGGGSGGGGKPAMEVVKVGAAPLLVQVRGAEAMAGVLRGLQLLARITPQTSSVTICPDRALILATLNVRWHLLPLTWWRPVRADTLIVLRFDAAGRVCSHSTIASWAAFLWAPLWQNPLADWLQRLWAPFSGAAVAALVRWAAALAAAARAAMERGRRERGVLMASLHGGKHVRPSGEDGKPGATEHRPPPPDALEREGSGDGGGSSASAGRRGAGASASAAAAAKLTQRQAPGARAAAST